MTSAPLSYESMLGIDDRVDCDGFRKAFKALPRNQHGIPLAAEAEAELRGVEFATLYEEIYDARKVMLKETGAPVSQLVRGAGGEIVPLNMAAVMSVPAFVQKLTHGENALFAVVTLHWMRADEKKEWVFSHLCEAVHAYDQIESLRGALGEASAEPFDDLRDLLREALRQFNHRHC